MTFCFSAMTVMSTTYSRAGTPGKVIGRHFKSQGLPSLQLSPQTSRSSLPSSRSSLPSFSRSTLPSSRSSLPSFSRSQLPRLAITSSSWRTPYSKLWTVGEFFEEKYSFKVGLLKCLCKMQYSCKDLNMTCVLVSNGNPSCYRRTSTWSSPSISRFVQSRHYHTLFSITHHYYQSLITTNQYSPPPPISPPAPQDKLVGTQAEGVATIYDVLTGQQVGIADSQDSC